MLKPRHLEWSGRRDVAGWWVPRRLGQARVLELWRAGTAVYETEEGWWLRLSQTQRLRAPWRATPLVDLDGLLCGCPLSAEERAVVVGVFARAEAGVLTATTPDRARRVDPSTWLDLDALLWPDTAALGPPPPRAAVSEPVVLERADFGVPDADPEVAALVAALRAEAAGPARDPLASIDSVVQPGDTLLQRLLRRVLALGGRWKASPVATPARLGSSGGQLGAEGRVTSQDAESGALAPTEPSLLQRLGDRLDRWARSMLLASGLGSLARRRQAQFLEELLHKLDSGDTLEALKRAIPLGGAGGGEVREWLGLPETREHLTPTLSASTGGGSGVGLSDDLYGILIDKYRAAAQRLERAQQIEEAAFVLSDLLSKVDEAVALLERHRRFELAAQLAAARDLSPERQVRLWWLAGNQARALETARRHQAWYSALALLEEGSDAHSRFLRAYAVELARSGRFVEAVEVGLPLGAGFVRGWVDLVVRAGGTTAATMQVRALQLGITEWSEHGPELAALLRSPEPEDPVRLAAIQALATEPAVPATEGLRRQALRAVLGDVEQPAMAVLARKLRALVHGSALSTDLPLLPDVMEGLGARFQRSADQRGVSAIHDAAWVEQGGVLVALGEAGVWLLDRDGRAAHHFDVPASELVVSHDGTRAIAIARRGELVSLCRLEVLERRCAAWCDAELSSWASAYDGARWFVVEGQDVVAIDVTASRLKALWRVQTECEQITDLRVTPTEMTARVVSASRVDVELWRWELPRLTLRERWAVPSVDGQQWLLGPLGGRHVHVGLIHSRPEDALLLRVRSSSAYQSLQLASAEPAPTLPELWCGDGLWAMLQTNDGNAEVKLFAFPKKERLQLIMSAATAPKVRLDGAGRLTYCDAQGRVFVWDEANARLLADFCIRL